MSRHPNQHIEKDAQGRYRFLENKIVKFLLEQGPFDMNSIAMLPGITGEDRSQFAQLIGYSVDGFAELSYADPKSLEQADRVVELLEREAKMKETRYTCADCGNQQGSDYMGCLNIKCRSRNFVRTSPTKGK